MAPLLLFDVTKCIGCHSCEVACQLENDVEPGLLMRKVSFFTRGQLPLSFKESLSTACFHCNDPSCVSACPAGALRRRKDGVVEHLRRRCIGCGYCVQACPFDVPKVSTKQHTMRKCSFCIQRIDEGKVPACAAKCTTGAITYNPKGEPPDRWENAYGAKEELHMVYALKGRPKEYRLPDPVPLNTVVPWQFWKWFAGFVPGAVLIGLLWQCLGKGEDHE